MSGVVGIPSLWLRHEVRSTERRAPITPADAAELVRDGLSITVERSPQRCFADADYADAGCRLMPTGSWPDAPEQVFVLGLKELPDQPAALRHQHVYFGHAYKNQAGSTELLRRFVDGGGVLLDIEYLTDPTGRRLAAFGYWAGYLGAALAVLHDRGRLAAPLQSGDRDQLDRQLADGAGSDRLRALVIGALGRSGRGACDALVVAGVQVTEWDVEQTRQLDRAALLDHHLLINTVLVNSPTPPFVTAADADDPSRELRVICDVTCDVSSPYNLLPVYDQLTSWQQPARRLRSEPVPLDVIAIDNLPALLPREATVAFSAELAPQLRLLGATDGPWPDCRRHFEQAVAALAG
ncbi:MAG TPA: saccharopine dehydrogenase [Jatrophihabitans sp.]|nr:saccharopine dehydrogenase [Jatrophihabitans sp.]